MSLVGEMGHNPRLLAVSCPRPTPPPLPILIRLVLLASSAPTSQPCKRCVAVALLLGIPGGSRPPIASPINSANLILVPRRRAMHVFSVVDEAEFDPKKHVEKMLGQVEAGDVTVACWEPGQISPYHCHPHATEIYFCFEGGGVMRTPDETIDVKPGAFVVHPPGEVHEYENGPRASFFSAGATGPTWRGAPP